MPVPDYLLVGHMTADLVEGGRVLGGTVSYAARTIHAFGMRVCVLTSARLDDVLLLELAQYTDDLRVIAADETSTFENVYAPDGARQQFIRAVAQPITAADVPPEWLKAARVHFAPLTGEVDAALVQAFPGATRLMTAQGMLREWDASGRVQFRRWADPALLRHLDWLVLSEEDYSLAPELEMDYASTVTNFVATRAERGGTHYRDGVPSRYDTPQVQVVQPTGAGDVFAAALLASLQLLDGDVMAALRVAAQLGAIAVTRPGWEGAPTPAEVDAALAAVR